MLLLSLARVFRPLCGSSEREPCLASIKVLEDLPSAVPSLQT